MYYKVQECISAEIRICSFKFNIGSLLMFKGVSAHFEVGNSNLGPIKV